ncbi:helix-turn-helix transcriptional regulator [Metabacillus sp. KIGAM252]|uniref:Helix-turn-helix transcriptional regulator n=1 Tax=Metabacillus flavus TaxID=2823519 RepID=A0ABS5LJT7_9BACI|nr:AraC family transcriptional regulator [Metabacillus flavus]MBS2970995.1 helix-turn-helix transcriptional regulator [Metabacillus flavus]
MHETYQSDSYLFTFDAAYLIESRDKPKMLEIITAKHKEENEQFHPPAAKKIDLYIWNAVYTREIMKLGVTKHYLHSLYNRFYTSIPRQPSLLALQSLEVEMTSAYFDLVIYDMEVTESFVTNKILPYLHMNIENHLSIKKLSEDLEISAGYASSCFKKEMGVSIMKYAKKIKIERAKILLSTTNKSIFEISMILCFHDQGHFSKTFKSLTGMSPTQYRRKLPASQL